MGFSKRSAKRVPRLLTSEQKCTRYSVSKSNLKLFKTDKNDFLAQFIAIYESWIQHYQLEIKKQSKQWKHTSSLALKS